MADKNLKIIVSLVDKFSKDLSGMSSSLTNFGKAATNAGKQLTRNLTVPLAIAGGLALKTANDFDKVIKSVQGTAKAGGAAAEELDELSDLAIEFGKKGIFGPQAVAEAMLDMVRDGLTPAQIAGGQLEAVYDLAAAAGENMANSQIALSDTLQAFGLRTNEASRVADVFSGILFNTPATLSDVATAMSAVAPVAGTLGVEMEELGVIMGLMADRGIRGSLAGTALRRGLLNLSSPTEQMSTLLKDLGVNVFDASGELTGLQNIFNQLQGAMAGFTDEQRAQTLQILFGARGVAGWSAALDAATEDVETLTEAVNRQGVAQEIAAFMTEGLSGKLAALKAQVQSAQIAMVTALTPAILVVTEAIINFFNWVATLDPELQKWIGITLVLVAGLGPLLVILGSVAAAIGFLMTPIGLVVIAIAALAVGIGFVIAQWDDLVDVLIPVVEWFDRIADAATRVKQAISGINIGASFRNLGANLFGGARADGGPVSPNKSFIVGERGPELFVPSVAGNIIPSMSLAPGMAGGGTVIQISNNRFGADMSPQDIGDAIVSKLGLSRRIG